MFSDYLITALYFTGAITLVAGIMLSLKVPIANDIFSPIGLLTSFFFAISIKGILNAGN